MDNKNKALDAEKKNSIPQDQSKLAKDIMKIIAISNVRLGDRTAEMANKEHTKYKETTLDIINLMFKHNIDLLEIELIFALMKQSIAIFEGTVQGSIDMSKNIALKKFWNKHPDELKLSDIEDKMKDK